MSRIPDTLKQLAVPIAGLVPYAGNARKHDIPALVDSLRFHGQYRPIVVRAGTNQILAGNGTHAAATELGWSELAVTFVDCTDDEAARIVLVDNRSNDKAGYDDEALAELLGSLPDLDGTGFVDDDLAGLLALLDPPAPQSETDNTSEPPKDPVTVRGDVWLLGKHRVICGDCRDHGDVEKLMGGRVVNVAFTSPPYASQRKYDESSGFKPIPPDEYVDWFEDVQANIRSVLAEDGSWFVNIKEHCDDGQRSLYVKDLTVAHVRMWGWMFVDELCWYDTRDGMPGRWPNRFKDAWEPIFHYTANSKIKFDPLSVGHATGNAFGYTPESHIELTADGYESGEKRDFGEGVARPSNVIRVPAGGDGTHSAAFPVALPSWFIKAYSDSGDAILDPFMGSGTTLIAAHAEGRTAFGLELSPAYTDVICSRYQKFTGDKPVLESTGEPHDFTTPDAAA